MVPSLHSEPRNPKIDFADSPFHVQRELAAWHPPIVTENGQERPCPRRAALSSFGAGGANAHLIVEEYENGQLTSASSVESSVEGRQLTSASSVESSVGEDPFLAGLPQLILLSAKNQERLRVHAERLADFLGQNSPSAPSPLATRHSPLSDIAYTLQTGREAMEERLALIVSDIDELREKLTRYARGETGTESAYHGNIRDDRKGPAGQSPSRGPCGGTAG